MAKRPTKTAEWSRPPVYSDLAWHRRHPYLPAIVASVVLVVYVLISYLVIRELPRAGQLAMALGFVALAVTTFLLATGGHESPEELIQRLRAAQQGEHLSRPPARTVRIPGVGPVSLRLCGGGLVGLIAAAWWLTPWAPVTVKRPVIDDLTVILAEDLVTGVLVLPEPHTAVVQPPVVPARARQVARLIREDAGPFRLGLKAIVEGRFDDARTQLDSAQQGQYAKEAQIQLARAQLAMYEGKFAEAAECYENVKPEQPMVSCQLVMAWVHQGDFRKPEVQELLTRIAKSAPLPDPAGAACSHIQCLLDVVRGKDLKECVKRITQGREAWKDVPGSDGPLLTSLLAAGLNNQAAVYVVQANYTQASVLFQKAADLWSQTPGTAEPRVAAVRINLAATQLALNDRTKAKASIEQAQEILDEDSLALPQEHPMRAILLNVRGALAHGLGDYEQARSSAELALRIARNALGPDHACVVPILDTLTAVCVDEACYARARKYCQRRVDLAGRIWGPEHVFLVQGLNRLVVLRFRARYTDAETLCQQAQKIAEQALGKPHPIVAAVLHTRGRLHLMEMELTHDRASARKYLTQSRDTWAAYVKDKQQPELKENPELALTLADLASLDSAPIKRVEKYNEAVEMLEKCCGSEHPEVARVLCKMAAALGEQQKWDEATAILDRAEAIQRKTLDAKLHPDLAETLETYAAILTKMDPPDAARAAKMQTEAKTIRANHAREEQAEANRES